MKTLLKPLFVLFLAAVLFAGCSNDSNPLDPSGGDPSITEPDPQPVPIKTPRYMRIEDISVKGFPKNKPNGDSWDWNPLSAKERKPDIHVILQRNSNYLPVFWSDERKNADYTSTYVFTQPDSPDDGELPYAVPYSETWHVYLIDRDFGGTDKMGSVTVKPSSAYHNDNATNFSKTITSGDLKIKVRGAWIY